MNVRDNVNSWVSQRSGLQETKQRHEELEKVKDEATKTAHGKEVCDLEMKLFSDTFEVIASHDQGPHDQSEDFGSVVLVPEGERWGTPRMKSLRSTQAEVSLTDVQEVDEGSYETTQWTLNNDTGHLDIHRQTLSLALGNEFILVEDNERMTLDTSSQELIEPVQRNTSAYRKEPYYPKREI